MRRPRQEATASLSGRQSLGPEATYEAMHVYTLVITTGPRRSAIRRAEILLERAVPAGFDRWGVGGRFSDRLASPAPNPERDRIIALHEETRRKLVAETRADLERQAASEEGIAFDLDAEDLASLAMPVDLPPIPADDQRHMVALTSGLPSPLPDAIVPAALVTPDAMWQWRPTDWEQGDPRWTDRVTSYLERHRGGHCVVVADCHC